MQNIVFLANCNHYKNWTGKTYYDLIMQIQKNNNEYNIHIFFDDEESLYVYNEIINLNPIHIFYFETQIIEKHIFNFLIDLNISYSVVLLDMFYVNSIINDIYIKKSSSLIHFSLNQSIIKTYNNIFPDKNILCLPSRYININRFKDYKLEKKYDILIYGSRNVNRLYKDEPLIAIQDYIKKYENINNTIIDNSINFYPLRSKLENILIKYSDKYKLKILPEKCIFNAIVANEDLSMLINESYLTISCSTIADILMHKYLEITASKSVILGNYPSDYKDLFEGNIIEVNEFMSEDEIIVIIDNALSDKNKLNEMSERLYQKIHNEHNLQKGQDDFNILVNKIINFIKEKKEKFNSILMNDGFYNFYNFIKNCDINNFKQDDNLTYMTEHIGEKQMYYGEEWYKEISNLNMIDNNYLIYLLNLNDRIGNPWLCNINNINCSPNSLKYVYFGLLTIKHILNKNINNINIIEIGGGYGGQCLILQELLNKFNIIYNKYIIIDLDNVSNFQKKYIEINNMSRKCEFINYEKYKEYNFDNNNFLFSSYALSQFIDINRNNYYENLLKYIIGGFIVWNTINIDFPLKYNLEREIPLTSAHNNFLYF
jgi:hypothetical protein